MAVGCDPCKDGKPFLTARSTEVDGGSDPITRCRARRQLRYRWFSPLSPYYHELHGM